MKKKQKVVSQPKQKKKRIVLWILLVLLLTGLALGGWQAYRILKKPASLFTEASSTPIPEPTILAPAFPIITATPGPEASAPTHTDAFKSTPAPSAPSDPEPEPTPLHRLNILLAGIDAFENGRTTSGTMPHTDEIMVIAINFDEDKVDLISLPRDTLTTAPGYHGYYKLNGVFNVGVGGWKRPTPSAEEMEKGFLLTCRAAEEWLGGISISYYYGVDFQAVIDIVDAIGGIDYDLDIPITSGYAFHRRSYTPGRRHLDGTAVMGYLRTRKGVTGDLDSARTDRQRRMMVAIFNKLKTEGKLSQIPSLIAAANSGIYTNTTISQTTALANYARNLNSDRIQLRSMSGDIGTREYEWRYAYVDQQNRIDMIREVFGIEAEPRGISTRQYERWLHTTGFSAIKYMRQAEKVLTKVQEKKNAGETFSEEQIALYSDCYLAYTALKEKIDESSNILVAIYADTPWREKEANRKNWTEENRARDREISAIEEEIKQALMELKTAVQDTTTLLGDSIEFNKLSWVVPYAWYNDPDINEVTVDFA